MSLGIRKILVIGLVMLILFAANIVLIANWLNDIGVAEKANWIRENFLTGSAITVIITLLILLVGPAKSGLIITRNCPVCNKRLLGNPRYCSDCGSRID